jgi:hypothetical protein
MHAIPSIMRPGPAKATSILLPRASLNDASQQNVHRYHTDKHIMAAIGCHGGQFWYRVCAKSRRVPQVYCFRAVTSNEAGCVSRSNQPGRGSMPVEQVALQSLANPEGKFVVGDVIAAHVLFLFSFGNVPHRRSLAMRWCEPRGLVMFRQMTNMQYELGGQLRARPSHIHELYYMRTASLRTRIDLLVPAGVNGCVVQHIHVLHCKFMLTQTLGATGHYFMLPTPCSVRISKLIKGSTGPCRM